MIKVIAFDLGDVVLTNDWHDGNQKKFDEFSAYFGVSKDNMERGWQAAWPVYKIGKINEDEFWRIFLVKGGAAKIDIEKCKKLYRKYQKPIEGMFSLLKKLSQNYQLAAISNTGKEWFEFKIKKFHLNDYFRLIIASCLEGVTKTNQEIYKRFLARIKAAPEECLFVDNQEAKLSPACSLGINVVLFKDIRHLRKDLSKFGVEMI